MAAFNPNAPEVNAQDETRRSEGIGTSHVFSTLFGGIGTLAGDYAKARDTQIQNSIYEDAVAARDKAATPLADALDTAGYTQLGTGADPTKATRLGNATDAPTTPVAGPAWAPGGRAASGVAPAGVDPQTTGSTAPNQPPPAEVTAFAAQAAKLQSALASGSISQAYYDAQLLSGVKGLRMKYPGYNQQIDSIVQNVTGKDPANALVADFYAEARANAASNASEGAKWQTFMDQHIASLNIVAPDVLAHPEKYSDPASQAKVRSAIGGYEGNVSLQNYKNAQLEAKAKQGTLDKQDVVQNVTGYANLIDGAALGTVMDTDTGLMGELDKLAKGGGAIDPNRIAAIDQAAVQIRLAQQAKMNKQFDQGIYQTQNPDGTMTYSGPPRGSFMTDAEKAQALKDSTRNIDLVLDRIHNDQYGLAAWNARMAKAANDHDINTIYANSAVARTTAALLSIGGPALVQEAQAAGGKYTTDRKALPGVAMDIISATGGGGSLTKAVDDVQKGLPEMGRADTSEMIHTHLTNVLGFIQTTKNPQMIANEVQYLFGKDNMSFLQTRVPKDQQAQVYAQMTAPGVSQAIFNATKDKPELWNQYRTWAAQNFTAMFATQAADLQKGVTGAQYVKFGWDPANAQVTYTINPKNPYAQLKGANPVMQGLAVLGMSGDDVAKGIISINGVNAVKDMNLALSSFKQIAVLGGEDPSVVMAQVLQGMGVDFKAPQQGSMLDQIGGAVNAAAQTVVQGLSGPSTTGAQTSGTLQSNFGDIGNAPAGVDTMPTGSVPPKTLKSARIEGGIDPANPSTVPAAGTVSTTAPSVPNNPSGRANGAGVVLNPSDPLFGPSLATVGVIPDVHPSNPDSYKGGTVGGMTGKALTPDDVKAGATTPATTGVVDDLTTKAIMQWEEDGHVKLRTYDDGTGTPTNGYGHTGPDVKFGQTITEEEAVANLKTDMARFATAVDKNVTVPMTAAQRTALISFAFNEGEGAFKGSGVLKAVNAGDWAKVPDELRKWNKARSSPNGPLEVWPGLVARREKEIAMLTAGSSDAGILKGSGDPGILKDPGNVPNTDPGILKDPGPVKNTDPGIIVAANQAPMSKDLMQIQRDNAANALNRAKTEQDKAAAKKQLQDIDNMLYQFYGVKQPTKT